MKVDLVKNSGNSVHILFAHLWEGVSPSSRGVRSSDYMRHAFERPERDLSEKQNIFEKYFLTKKLWSDK